MVLTAGLWSTRAFLAHVPIFWFSVFLEVTGAYATIEVSYLLGHYWRLCRDSSFLSFWTLLALMQRFGFSFSLDVSVAYAPTGFFCHFGHFWKLCYLCVVPSVVVFVSLQMRRSMCNITIVLHHCRHYCSTIFAMTSRPTSILLNNGFLSDTGYYHSDSSLRRKCRKFHYQLKNRFECQLLTF